MSDSIVSALQNKQPTSEPNIHHRSKLALDDVLTDAKLNIHGLTLKDVSTAFEGQATASTTNVGFIEHLWTDEGNKNDVTAFMNNKFCHDAAYGVPGSVDAFKNYSVQDYFYLVDRIKFKALRLATIPRTDTEAELKYLGEIAENVHKAVGDAAIYRTDCINNLHIQPKDFEKERNVPELAYAQFLQNNSSFESWFNLHVITIACNYGWSKLAVDLYEKLKGGGEKDNELFYKYWIMKNVSVDEKGDAQLSSSAVKLADFLNKYAAVYMSEENEKRWNALFRTTLRLEVAFFNSAYDKPL